MFGVISSLRTLASLRPERIFPGDGKVSRTPLPELHEKIGQLIRLAREVARLDADGQTVPEMVAHLFSRESTMNFWTWGHFSAIHLVEACRSYNAIFAPLDNQDPVHPAAAAEEDETANPSDSSTTWSTDWGDMMR